VIDPVVIGDARLYLGDCRAILPTLGEIDSLVCDPPYGMSFQSNYRAEQHRRIAGDDDRGLLTEICSWPVLRSRYVFCRWDDLVGLPKPKSLITWVKNNWSMGDLEHEHGRQTEVVAFWPGEHHLFPNGRPNDVIRAPRTGNDEHPTEKPVGLMQAIVEWTVGTVVDPCMGSGTTGVACMRAGRPFIGIEIDLEHFATAVRRITEANRAPDMFASTRTIAPAVQEPLL
jgi:site-specific DNA-methyltransferase (adenine-specific)